MKKILIVLGLFFLLSTNTNAAPVRWEISDGGNGHYYEAILVESGITWTNSNLAADSLAGDWHLVTITSAAENSFVYNLINNNSSFWAGPVGGNYNGPWIGAYRSGSAYRWVTTESFSYTNWGPGEPGQGYPYVSFFGYHAAQGAYWNDVSDSYPSAQPRGYIVESAVPIPGAVWLLASGFIGILSIRRKLK